VAYYVCKGAKLKCSMGSQQSDLDVFHPVEGVNLCGKPMAGISDSKPMVNIKPFGQCKSLVNPTVAAATAANSGRLQEMPCIPNTTAPWLNGKMNLIIKGSPALLGTSKCMCMWAGVIEITNPGQNTVREGGTMNVNINTDSSSGTSLLQAIGGIGSNLLSQGMNLLNAMEGADADKQQNAETGVAAKVKEIYWSYGTGRIRLSDKSRFYVDLNLHVKTEDSNDGDFFNVTLKRNDGLPLFGTSQTLELSGTVSCNEAVIENVFKSYSLCSPSEITAECSGVKASLLPRRPRWEDVYGGYPKIKKDGSEADMYMDDVFKYILGNNYDHKLFNNGGAARVSIGLIEAGMEVRKDFLVQDGSEFKKKLIQKNKDNEKKRIGFIASAKNLQEWLVSVWGKADVEMKCESDDVNKVKAAIKGRNGVYIILGYFDSGASGATTLWIGSENDALGGLNYIRKGRTVYFWELRGKGEDLQKCSPDCEYKDITSDIHKKLGCVHYGNIRNMFKDNLSQDEYELFGLMEKNIYISDIKYESEELIKSEETVNKEKDKIVRMPNFGFVWDNNKVFIYTNIECDMFDNFDCRANDCKNKECRKIRDSLEAPRDRKHSRKYQATIHEIWHCIDYLATKKLPNYRRDLLAAIKQDFENEIKKVIEEKAKEKEERNGKEVNKAIEFFVEEHRNLSGDKSHLLASNLFYFLDIIDGICTFHNVKFKSFIKRKEGYWTEKMLLAEYFADVGCVRAANPIALGVIERYLPKSYAAYKNIIKIILEEWKK